MHGGAGMSKDFPLAMMFVGARALRIADGPDEVHIVSVAASELKALARKHGAIAAAPAKL